MKWRDAINIPWGDRVAIKAGEISFTLQRRSPACGCREYIIQERIQPSTPISNELAGGSEPFIVATLSALTSREAQPATRPSSRRRTYTWGKSSRFASYATPRHAPVIITSANRSTRRYSPLLQFNDILWRAGDICKSLLVRPQHRIENCKFDVLIASSTMI